ncbi:Polymyxin resistance protein ArnT, undecaprenyl phosphate-alpha-L-Ara4N transferase; Melittin resistance protein PqaB [hydrothermal vent metagenome]|uniref:Polymyxin resistance protein ArnT, undecaprenyl phosphate-alpha-L-Ara4N transferase Melittin resistance protein PqaB n=1 Tax=hydrothermal vent metagenome TaxID=652676 RepID=A0A3B0YRB3_9ZZZZ
MNEKSSTSWLELLLATSALAAIQLWLRPLFPVDETRYLSVAWEMWQRGDFLVPWLNGEPYSHKPPLLFWLTHGLWSVFGVSALPPRVLMLVLSLLALWLSALLAHRLWPRQADSIGALTPWLLLGGLFWHNFFTLVQFDMLLVLAALWAWLGLLDAVQRPFRGWLQVGAALGLGILAKGPVIFLPVLPVALLAPWWLSGQSVRWLHWYAGLIGAVALSAAIALAWAIPAGQAGGEAYRQAIFWGQSAGRVVNSFAHRSPWWTYLWLFPGMWLPWLVWPALWRALWQFGRPARWDAGVRFCLAVLVPALLLFSLVSGKQGKYLLPLFPVLAVLFARALVEWHRLWPDQRIRLDFAALLLALTGILLLVLPWWSDGPAWLGQVQLMWGPALLLWAFVLMRLSLPLAATVRVAALTMMFTTAVVYLGVLSLATTPFDMKPPSRQIAHLQELGYPVAWLGKYHGQFNFVGRLQQRIEPLQDEATVQRWLKANRNGYLLVNNKTPLEKLPAGVWGWPYRGGSLILWPAAWLLSEPDRLDSLV